MAPASSPGLSSPFESQTFEKDVSIYVNDSIGAASISPSGRDVVLASKNGLLIIDLDSPYSPPRQILNRTEWEVADVQWSPFAQRADWIASTCNQKALIYNLSMNTRPSKAPIQHVLHAHDRAITDINFSAHHPDFLATCAVDSYVFTWDLRGESKPVMKFADFDAGATQVKWNRQDEYIIASSHDRLLRIWDTRYGAMPITSINAHSTKIYGIDWDRANRHRILTCGLDHSVKLWDWSKHTKNGLESFNPRDRYKFVVENPEKIIKTPFPVWRARHTPFAHGILALPQRGSSALHLYDERNDDSNAVHRFHAHEETARVKEFLWRTRGKVDDDGIDNREFQLISWGSDLHLHLHRIKLETLEAAVGYKKGRPVEGKPSMTRRGAEYVTYREEPARTSKGDTKPRSSVPPIGTLSSLLQQANLSYARALNPTADSDRVTMTAPQARNTPRKVVNHIKWMEGVKVGERITDSNGKWIPSPVHRDEPGSYPWSDRDDLASEVRAVGSKYKKVDFEKVDHAKRQITVSLYRPCGPEERLAFLRVNIQFPASYPRATYSTNEDGDMEKTLSPPDFELEKTTAAISQDTLNELHVNLQTLLNHYAILERPSLEAMIRFLLGERLDASMTLDGDGEDVPGLIPAAGEEESSDDEDDDDDEEEVDHGTNDKALIPINADINVPLPRQCSATFSAAGILSYTRIPYEEPPSRFVNPSSRGLDIFETFGRLRARSPSRDRQSAADDDWSPGSSDGSWISSSGSSSSVSSSEFDDGLRAPRGKFQPPLAWQKATLRFQNRTSHPSSTSAVRPVRPKSVLSIMRSVEEFIPSKRVLGEEYEIFGDGPSVCVHNARVARKHGFEDIATIWDFCKLILNNQVPLDVVPQQHRREPVLVLARRALVRIKRKDSGLDLQFDEADAVTNPKLKGRVKWGQHPVATWLIPALLEYFEKLADTQMLAMLSCIFSEPAAQEKFGSAVSNRGAISMATEAPAYSRDYFPSADAAWSLFKPTISIPPTPRHSRGFATPTGDGGRSFDTYGSHGSSNGPWGSDHIPSEPVTPYSTGNTPPTLSRVPTFRSLISHTPFSTSPEQHQTSKKLNSNLVSAFASLSRPFSNVISSSPPVKARHDGDLSTSAPTSGVTWGTTTFISSTSTAGTTTPHRSKHGKRASFGHAERINIDYISDSDSEFDDDAFPDTSTDYTVPAGQTDGNGEGKIRVILKNQDQFDDEACVSAPLLDLKKEWLHKRWREQYAEMLGLWGLVTKRAEVLKFNGLVSYFPVEGATTTQSHLVLKSTDEETPPDTSITLSRSSSLLAPQPPKQSYSKRRSPGNSPRNFSFNPEAMEFKPGAFQTTYQATPFAPPLDTFLSLSILAPNEPSFVLTPAERSQRPKNKARNPLNRSRESGRTAHDEYNSEDDGRPRKKGEKPQVCSTCWLRVQGRFYFCATCGHIAHFDCVSRPSGKSSSQIRFDLEQDGCVVGCGCGCSEEVEESGGWGWELQTPWDERGGWLMDDAGGVVDGEKRRRSVAAVNWYESGGSGFLESGSGSGYPDGYGSGFANEMINHANETAGVDVHVWSPGGRVGGKGKRRG